MAKISTIRTNFEREKQRFSSRKTEIFRGQFHAPAAQFFSAVGPLSENSNISASRLTLESTGKWSVRIGSGYVGFRVYVGFHMWVCM